MLSLRSLSTRLSVWYVSVPQRSASSKRRGTDRREHELLDVDVALRVRATVEHVEQRHRQDVRVRAADVAVEGQAGFVGRRGGDGERHAEDRVGAEPALVGGAVERAELVVEHALVFGFETEHDLGDLGVDVLDRGADALAAVALTAVAQLDRLVRAGARPAGDRGTSTGTRRERDLDLDRRVAP